MGLEEFNPIDDDDMERTARTTEEMHDEIEVMYDSFVKKTPDAYLLKFDDKDIWLPKSQVRIGDGKSIFIPNWLAFEKELI